jgi:steroid delta-isomerase-like uncharacterized protein
MNRTDSTRIVAIVITAMASLASCATPATEDSTVARNEAMIRAYVDASNRGDTSYLDEYLSPDYVYHGAAGELDAAGFKAFHDLVLAAFPGLTLRIEDMIGSGERVVTRWTLEGVHRGEFQGIAPTGNEVTVTGIIISRFEDGRVVEEWEQADLLGLLRQLGAMAGPS